MFHPVGPQPPSVYWRRRLVLLAAVALVIVLIVLTVKIAASGGDQPAAGSTFSSPTASAASTPPPVTSTHPTTHTTSSSAAPAPSSHRSSSRIPKACAARDLAVQAVVGKPSYRVGDKPLLELQVTNVGTAPCVQDLADKQVVLKVYNGESRVWGSHDCQVEPGSNPRTLAVNRAVRVAISWSGLSSQPNCAGTRQRVGAGTYTLYAQLSGKTGKSARFTIGS